MIRLALQKDKPALHELLQEVLEIHAKIRPDIFISGTTKYTDEELSEIIEDETRPIFVAVDENDEVLGYCFTILRKQPVTNNMHGFDAIYIDDLCVSEKARGQHVGTQLIEHVKQFAKERGCYELTLNVWQGNDSARKFYDDAGFTVKQTGMEFILK